MNSIDVHDWEILPKNGYLDDGGTKTHSNNPNTNSFKSYFFSPPKSVETRVHPEMSNQLALEPTSQKDATISEDDDDSQVLLKKMKESSRADFHFEEKGIIQADLKESGDRFNIWKLNLFGVAAAGVCVIISWGNSNKQQQNQKQNRRI